MRTDARRESSLGARAQLCICVVALGLNNGPRNSFTITNLPSNDFFHRRRLDVNFLTDLPDLSLPQLPIRYNALTTPSHKSAHTNSSRYRNQVIHAACVISLIKENRPGNKIPTPFLPKGNDDVSCVNYLRVDAAA